jgi:hypothetical protein
MSNLTNIKRLEEKLVLSGEGSTSMDFIKMMSETYALLGELDKVKPYVVISRNQSENVAKVINLINDGFTIDEAIDEINILKADFYGNCTTIQMEKIRQTYVNYININK